MSESNWREVLAAWLERLRLGRGWQQEQAAVLDLLNLPGGAAEKNFLDKPDEQDMLLLLGRGEKPTGGVETGRRSANYLTRQTAARRTAGGIWPDPAENEALLKEAAAGRLAAKKPQFKTAANEMGSEGLVIKIPAAETPEKGTVKKETAKKETSKKETSKKEIPKKETPEKEMFAKETLAKETLQRERPEKQILKNAAPETLRKQMLGTETPPIVTLANGGGAGITAEGDFDFVWPVDWSWRAEKTPDGLLAAVESSPTVLAQSAQSTQSMEPMPSMKSASLTNLAEPAAQMDVDRLADLVAEKLRNDIEAVLGSSSLV